MRWIVGLILVAAAFLKALELYQFPAVVLGSSFSWFLKPVLIGIELGLGLCAITNIYWASIRPWIAVFFAGFASYSFLLAIQDYSSCGCFGQIEVNPWWTCLLDIGVSVGLALECFHKSRKEGESENLSKGFPALRAAGVVVVSLSVAIGLTWHVVPRQATSRVGFQVVGDLVILEPETWIGKIFPLLEEISIDASHGKWVLLLHRHDCPDCHEAIPKYKHLAMLGTQYQVALIEVPPYGPGSLHSNDPSLVLSGQLTDDREWFVQTPTEIIIENGVVTSASTELPIVANLATKSTIKSSVSLVRQTSS